MTAVELLQEVFLHMSPTEPQEVAAEVIHFASDGDLLAELRDREKNDCRTDFERHPLTTDY